MRRFAPLLLLLAAACHAQQDLANLDLETGALGEPPPGWAFPDDHEGYRIALVGEAAEGAQAVTVAADPTAERTRAFVPLTKVVDAAPYRGQRLRFRAAARAVIPEGQQGTAHLWLRIDGAGGEVLAFENMRDRPITDSAWATYEVSGDAGERAEQIAFGFFLQGDGQAWFDDAALEAVGELTPLEVDPPRALTTRGRQNLIAFGRLLGYVRHFHPADATAETDWDAFAVRGVRAVEDAPDADALAARLDRLFASLAPTVQVYPTGEAAPPLPGALHRPEGEATVTRWVHTGFAESGARSVYGSERRRVPADSAAVPAAAVFRADLGGGVSAAVPLAL
jgi:hypothetical protein